MFQKSHSDHLAHTSRAPVEVGLLGRITTRTYDPRRSLMRLAWVECSERGSFRPNPRLAFTEGGVREWRASILHRRYAERRGRQGPSVVEAFEPLRGHAQDLRAGAQFHPTLGQGSARAPLCSSRGSILRAVASDGFPCSWPIVLLIGLWAELAKVASASAADRDGSCTKFSQRRSTYLFHGARGGLRSHADATQGHVFRLLAQCLSASTSSGWPFF